MFYQFISLTVLLVSSWSVEGQSDEKLELLLQAVKPPHFIDSCVSDGEEFDFIVVGAGTAGCVVASRLSENPAWTVLLLEAGGDPPVFSEVPALMQYMQQTEVDWQYVTEPQSSACQGMVGHRCSVPRGKMVGGCGSHNDMVYTRGHPSVFDEWADMGCYGWSYRDILPYFKKSEGMRSPYVLRNRDALVYHSTTGCLSVDEYGYTNEILKQTLSYGYAELGYSSYYDANADDYEGFFLLQATLQKGKRGSTAKAFLRPAQSRPNLKISKHSYVTKIHIGSNNMATGVEFVKNNCKINVKSKKEVIVSGGSVNSPQLLMLSGVGPRKHEF